MSAPFGELADGTPAEIYTLRNNRGLEARVISYGAIITSLRTPDSDGQYADIVLGFDDLDGYVQRSPYFGAVVGRFANRIANGRFVLDGKTYQLPINDPPNTLHGGDRGFDKVVWDVKPRKGDDVLELSHTSPDGDQGFPGELIARVIYTLSDDNELSVEYHATTTKPTPVNLSQHSYFNLTGDARRDVLNHLITLSADRYTPIDATKIPTGELASVEGTPFDLRLPTRIGARIDVDDEQLRYGNGFDHNFVLNRTEPGLMHVGHVAEPDSGRIMEVYTTEPGVQFYSGNSLDGSIRGKGGHAYGARCAFCLETQHFPDSPNHPEFPSTILRPGEELSSRTVFAFGAQRDD
jgi:aldose 1-epimerase